MLRLVTCFLFLSLPLLARAQITLTGKITDAADNSPLPFTQVALLSKSDSTMVTGAVSDVNGRFSLSAPTGEYFLNANYIGYTPVWQPVQLTAERDMGTLKMEAASEVLGEIEVTAAAMLFRSEADKRVYNVENMIVAEGGTAIQVLETLPSVQIDEEGNIRLRGSSNVLIYINGRPSNLSSDDVESILDQFPASAIKEIELITNPSARYDAEGIGGIINIILKEDRRRGANGQVNLTAGTGHKYTGALTFNVRRDRLNFFASYAYQYRQLWEQSNSLRENFTGNASPLLDQDFDTRNYNQSHLVRTGFEMDFNSAHHASVFTNINYRMRDRERLYHIRSLTSATELDSMYTRLLTEDQSRSNYEFGLNYRFTPAKNGTRLNVMASYALESQDRIEYFDQRYFNAAMEEVAGKQEDQTYERPLESNLLVVQADYERPLSGEKMVEAGLKATVSGQWRGQIFNDFNFGTGMYELNDLITNDFSFDEGVYAAYAIFRNKWGALSYLAGLRAEYTATESYQPKIDSTHINNYFNLFPSLFLTYAITKAQELQLNYSRRITRPRMGALMPFYNAQDLYNLRLGNPYLQPEFTDNVELSYIRRWERYMLTGTAFYRNTQNAITRVFHLFEDRSAVVTWANANTQNASGLELVNYLTLGRNFDATLTGNLFYSRISGSQNGQEFFNDTYSWTLSLLGNWRIQNLFSLQLLANYSGPIVLAQGYVEPRFGLNAGIRKQVLKNRGTVALNVSDAFNTLIFNVETHGNGFNQIRSFNRETRIATLSFTYRFRDFRDQAADRRRDTGGVDDISDDAF